MKSFWPWLLAILFCGTVAMPLAAAPPAAAGNTAAGSTKDSAAAPTKLPSVWNEAGNPKSSHPSLGLGGRLAVALDGTAPLDAAKWVLYLNGRAIPDLTAVTRTDPRRLVFTLLRTAQNKDAWKGILDPPAWTRAVEVSVAGSDPNNPARLVEPEPPAVFQLTILWTLWFGLAVVIALAVVFLTGLAAVRTPMLRDNLLAQIPPAQRPFSLGKCQMAFWFVLIIMSFLFLWALLWDYNTISSGALTLMGISAATAVGALAANTTNNDALTTADQQLRAAGFEAPGDIGNLLHELDDKLGQAEHLQRNDLPAKPALDAAIKALQDRKLVYDKATKDYITAIYRPRTGRNDYSRIFLDLIADKDGPALHRMQIVAWTFILGLVFLVGVYRDLSMPDFNATLLALMGISGASYVGFKFPEQT